MRRCNRGFTLVEILVALVVLSLISLGTLTAMRTLGSTQEKLTATTDRVDELRQVSRFLRNTLRQAMPSPEQGGGGTWASMAPKPSVQGSDREIVWLAPLTSVQGVSGLNRLRLYLDESTLRLQFAPYAPGSDDFTWDGFDEGHVLVEDVEEFAIAYRTATGEPWLDALEENNSAMPQAVRITLKARGRYWPDLIVAPDRGMQ